MRSLTFYIPHEYDGVMMSSMGLFSTVNKLIRRLRYSLAMENLNGFSFLGFYSFDVLQCSGPM